MKMINTKRESCARTGNKRPIMTFGENHLAWRKWHPAMLLFLVMLPLLSAQAAVDSVDVDQSPLIVSEPLPPNIMVMYDDSGSMGWDYLYPSGVTRTFKDVRRNKMYYDPRVEYKPPFKADGSRYPESTFPNGYRNPFTETRTYRIDDKDGDYGERIKKNVGNWNGNCGTKNKHVCAFAYVDPDSGTNRYVAEDCSRVSGNRCSDDSGVQQNVANWFSYYRIREFAAKSGLMNAFYTLNPNFRVGFGSLNNNGSSYINNNVTYNFSKEGKRLAGVERFGASNETGVQRDKFWGWLETANSNGGTPLRKSLKAVGEYYKDEDHSWQSQFDNGSTYSSDIYSCRSSFSILISDGSWNGNDPGVGNADKNGGEGKPFADDNNNMLADVAYKYWKTNLRPNLKNDVPVTDRDSANWQHMTTFTVGLGVEPNLANDGGGSIADIFNWARTGNAGSINTTSFKWGGDKIADMAHAAVNGRGDFFSARDPQEFADGLKQALAAIESTPGAGSSPSFSGGQELTSKTTQYFVSYMTGSWTGELRAASYDTATDTFTKNPWRASSQLPVTGSRNIWTVDKAGTAVEFKHGNLGDYLATLGDNIYKSDPKGAAWGRHVVDYIRGERAYEDSTSSPLATTLRKRDTILGDIVGSTPVVVGDPKADLYKHVQDETYFAGLSAGSNGKGGYTNFAADKSGRTPVVYVAANDGMLHAFNAASGVELFAFIPGALLGATGDASLARLANPEYGVYDPVNGKQPIPHQYYNDGKLTTQNVYIDGSWKTILVGTTGRGISRTVYALDVTNPADLADPQKAKDAILWERSAGDGKSNDEWIGMALGRPTISLIKESSQGNKGTGKWVAHLGNGPNSEKGQAALLQFDLKTGDLKVYAAGTASDNGMSAPYVIQKDDTDGVSEYAFAGDLQGNVWRFELSPSGGNVSQPLYVAKDSDGNRQPITADMYATHNPDTGAIWVFFGTGRFLTKSDILENNPKVQTWYGLRALAGPSGLAEVKQSHSRNDLQERTIIAEKSTSEGMFRVTSDGDSSDLTSDGDVGWYMDLVSPVNSKEGERIVYQSQLIAGRLIVNTLIPKSSSPCDPSPGGATLIVDPFSGANPGTPVLDADGDGKIDSKDSVTIGGKLYYYNGERYNVGMAGVFTALRASDGSARLFGSALDSSEVSMETTMGASGSQRLNWHEIIN